MEQEDVLAHRGLSVWEREHSAGGGSIRSPGKLGKMIGYFEKGPDYNPR